MNNDKTALIKKVVEHKALDMILKLVVLPLLIALVVGLTGWLWKTSSQIVTIMNMIEQDKGQWMSIKKNADDVVEVRVRLGVLEILSGIPKDNDGSADHSNLNDIDINKLFEEVDREHRNRRDEDVDEFVQMQRIEKK